MEKKGKRYTDEDTKCPHCGGNIYGHVCGGKVVYWCDKCGSNNRFTPPNISVYLN